MLQQLHSLPIKSVSNDTTPSSLRFFDVLKNHLKVLAIAFAVRRYQDPDRQFEDMRLGNAGTRIAQLLGRQRVDRRSCDLCKRVPTCCTDARDPCIEDVAHCEDAVREEESDRNFWR